MENVEEETLSATFKEGQSGFFFPFLLFQQVALDVHQRPLVSCSTGWSQSVAKKAFCVFCSLLFCF